MGMVHGVPKQLQWKLKNQLSQITRTNKIIIVCSILRITKMWHRYTKLKHAVGKNAANRLAGLPQPSVCKNHNLC